MSLETACQLVAPHLVPCRALDVVDDQKGKLGFGGLQLQAKLLAESVQERRTAKFGKRIASRLGRAIEFWSEFDGEVEMAGEARLVHYGVIQPAHSRECV